VWVFEGRTEGTDLSEKEVTRRLADRQSRKASLRKRKNTTDSICLAGTGRRMNCEGRLQPSWESLG
jgi:hypothetical protein